jgi:uncharacterized protein (DUF736 family)
VADLTGSTCRRNGAGRLFSAAFGFAARSKKAALWPSQGRKPTPTRRRDGNPEQRCAAERPRSTDRHEAAMGAARTSERRIIMSTIGTFSRDKDGGIVGKVVTLTLNTRAVFTPVEKDASKAPDYRLTFANADHVDVEVGAAWIKTSRNERDYLSVKIDDPSFPAPLYASLVESNERPGEYVLLWSR